ncbi:MAG: AI-2E family transporter, partial [Pseudomonadota bacterium]
MRSPDKTAQRIIARKVTVISNTLLLIAALTAVVFAADILIPVALAALLTMLLSPIVCRLVRLGVPAPLASVGVLACTLLTVLVTILALSDPAERWISEAPRSVEDFRSLLDQERSELDSLSKFAAEVDQIATGEVPS